MSTFTNKVAVITGGNSGIGLAAAKEFSRRGAKVVISGRDEKTLAEAAASIGLKFSDKRQRGVTVYPRRAGRPKSSHAYANRNSNINSATEEVIDDA